MSERVGLFKALGRSYGLIKERFWATLLLIIVSFLLIGIIGGIVSAIPSVFAEILRRRTTSRWPSPTWSARRSATSPTRTRRRCWRSSTSTSASARKGFDVQMLAEGLGQPFDPDAPIPAPLQPVPYAQPPQTWQPQGGQYGEGWNAPSYQDAPLRWGPGAQQPQQPPDTRPPEESPWMRPAPGARRRRCAWRMRRGPSGPPPAGEPGAGPSRWAPPVAPTPPPTGPAALRPAGPGTPDESLWGRRTSEPGSPPPAGPDESRWARPGAGEPPSAADEARWGAPRRRMAG